MSGISFWKDLIAQISDAEYQGKAASLGLEISPANLLRCRMAFFYADEISLPPAWPSDRLPLDLRLAAYNEGGRVEPQSTAAGKLIVDGLFLRRLAEVEAMVTLPTVEAFGAYLRDSLRAEMEELVLLAGGNLHKS
jgi:hypothetical protein